MLMESEIYLDILKVADEPCKQQKEIHTVFYLVINHVIIFLFLWNCHVNVVLTYQKEQTLQVWKQDCKHYKSPFFKVDLHSCNILLAIFINVLFNTKGVRTKNFPF